MSLLGRLLSGAGTSISSPRHPLDSHLEDQFTYNLLFPDPEALCHNDDQVFPLSSATILPPAASRDADLNGEVDLEMRDVRVIIMQETTPASGSSYLLYDSHSPSPPSPSWDRPAFNGPAYPAQEARGAITAPRKTSVGQASSRPAIPQEPATPTPRVLGAFAGRSQHRRNPSCSETEGQRSAREYKEEVTWFANYMFGNSDVMAYKGTGTKVHYLPPESRPPLPSTSYLPDGSLGRSSMRSSKLAHSFTSDTVHGPTPAVFTSSSTARAGDKRKVLITRMFPVPLPNDETEDVTQNITPTPQNSSQSHQTAGYPFPQVTGGSTPAAERKTPQPKQKRTPLYAVGLIVNLPQTACHAPSATTSRSSFRAPGSYTEQESLSSSFNSGRRSGWTMLGNGFGIESMDSSFSSEVEADRIDIVTPHWDIIMRTMSHLQAVATTSLLPLLKQADISSPDPRRDSQTRAPSASVSIAGKRVAEDIKPFKIPKTNAKMVSLTPHCLAQSPRIQREADAARQRIVNGLRAYQVVTGQGRWGIWREEARLVGKWAGSKDEGFFFFNLLTGFLGNHTEWLQALGPSWYRRKHSQQQRANKDDDISLPARTIVVSDHKVMARRLIFLLAAFLPANQQVTAAGNYRPSTSISFGGYSQSPPNHVPIPREESLRRKINKRGSAARGAHARTSSFPNQVVSGLGIDIHDHGRRTSDAASIKTANLPIPGSDIQVSKSRAVTTSTATPVITMPHFSTRRPIRGTGPVPRPGSSGSLATDDLIRSLKRGDSTGHHSNGSTDSQGQNNRWSNIISGFWGRRGSTASTSIDPQAIDDTDIHDAHCGSGSLLKQGKLAGMVEEAGRNPPREPQSQQERNLRQSESGSSSTAKPAEGDEQDGGDVTEQTIDVPDRVPDPSGAFQSPVKTSINAYDGVIDIDVPLPEFLSFESAVSSPSSSGYLSTPGLGNGMESFEYYARPGPDVETTMNVGGWLPRYHPDFALQAVPVHDGILEEVKASLRAEPTPVTATTTPFPEGGRPDRWVDISSAVIANTTNFTIRHIRYRRLIRPRDLTSEIPSVPHSFDSRYGNPYSAAQLTPSLDATDGYIDEQFIEEPIISMDETLIEAIERVIAQSGDGSKNSSPCSSRSPSRRGGNNERSTSTTRSLGMPEHKLEVPRNECKRMVLSALEEIVKEVAGSRKKRGDTKEDMERESFLREGVRSWLCNVETGDASHF
ncbi:hypothetical protein MBM_06696 [Drepanopeziza brunnea f. sp. 'multigermtubi' MB_m1]|uniref:Folliculin-interacting protein N-terminal domain-containing protein n=1 Tax=Marssonina brunnea f. sp. multigermtubi (strain MB_m1) TaxID=1072389 RepID=K1WC21_MARBU|nr:uncharacterized protein MBM_06696 [Drepanopeziza brunnea f. sp. 'multigermtubi' MB_m1]EKD14935.1 hypothetical protein MBM_06696 [Drepanopeziza brunnea f. sp. 'multigermtubi' MB_m1]